MAAVRAGGMGLALLLALGGLAPEPGRGAGADGAQAAPGPDASTLAAEGDGTRFTAQVNRYQGSDGVSVYSPGASVRADLDPRTQVALHYQVDAVSAASFNYAQSKTHRADPLRVVGDCKLCHSGVDAISGASVNYKDERHEVGASVLRRVGDSTLTPSYTYSQEDDYLSQTVDLALGRDFFSRDSTLTLDAAYGNARIQPVWNLGIVSGLVTRRVGLDLTQVLTARTQAKVSGEWADEEGLLSNPYSFVQIGQLTERPELERHPLERVHKVLAGAIKQSLGWDTALELGYRWYGDDWAVDAHTLSADLAKQAGPLLVHAGWRHYSQTQAWFFQNLYQQDQAYISRDLKLAAFSDDQWDLGLTGNLGRGWDVNLSYTRFQRQDSLDYSLYYADRPVTSDLVSVGFNYR